MTHVNGVVVRQVKKDDLPAMEWEGEYTHFRRLYADAYHRAVTGSAVLWVAEAEGLGLIGQLFVHLENRRNDFTPVDPRAYIYGFRVRPGFRRKGIGTRMLQVAENDLARRGFHHVVLNVGQDNQEARRLYERHGYSVIGSDPGRWSYLDDQGCLREVHEPAWRMEKWI